MHCLIALRFACLVHCIVCGFDRDLQCLPGAGAGRCVVCGGRQGRGSRSARRWRVLRAVEQPVRFYETGYGGLRLFHASLALSTTSFSKVCSSLFITPFDTTANTTSNHKFKWMCKKTQFFFCCNFFYVLVSLFHPVRDGVPACPCF
jgi:hypothetical protein